MVFNAYLDIETSWILHRQPRFLGSPIRFSFSRYLPSVTIVRVLEEDKQRFHDCLL